MGSRPKETAVASKIVVCTPLPKVITDLARAMVPDGYDLEIVDAKAPELPALMKDADYFVGFGNSNMGPEFYAGATKLKLVQLLSAGYDRLDIEAARRAGVPIANNGGSNSVAVSEHAIMLMLALLKKLAWHHANVSAGKWRLGTFGDNRLYELAGKTVGIVGLGTIGKKVARRLKGWDVQTIYYDVVRLTEDQEDALGVRFVLFEELLRTADVVTLHVPLSARTRNLMSARQFGLMKKDAILINTCRGPVVDEDALHRALTGGQIAAAGLDVMTEEPPKTGHPLFVLENVILTPHMAGPTWENWTKAFRNAFDNVQRVASGQTPLWVIPELR
jgi:glyoxylate reductase/D-3-phosphoglycerate dehydrogenase